MKKILIVSMCFILSACVDGQNKYAVDETDLEQSKDLIKTLNLYSGTEPTLYCDKKCERRPWHERSVCKQDCPKEEAEFFANLDRARFLPENAQFPDESTWNAVLTYYKLVKSQYKACDDVYPTPRYPDTPEVCREKILKPIYRVSEKGIENCEKALGKEYTNELKEYSKWYKWSQNHDFWETSGRQIITDRQQRPEQAMSYIPEPVLDAEIAKLNVAIFVENFGKENLCSVDGYKNIIKKYGINYK